VFYQHRLGAKTGTELDLVECAVIGRVGNRREQPVAAPEQREGAIFPDDLLADAVRAQQFRVERVEIEQWQSEFR